jgi:hypothetical protein
LLNSRLLRAKIPTKKSLLSPKVVDAHQDLKDRQYQQKKYYDRHARPVPLPPLKTGDVIRVQRGKVWQPAIVRNAAGPPRSYIIQHEGGQLRRNRRHLIKSCEPPPLLLPPTLEEAGNLPSMCTPIIGNTATPALAEPAPQPVPEEFERRSRSGRLIRKPLRFQDM